MIARDATRGHVGAPDPTTAEMLLALVLCAAMAALMAWCLMCPDYHHLTYAEHVRMVEREAGARR